MDERMVHLRRYLSLVHVTMNRAYGYNLGRKSELSPSGVYIVYLCHFYRLRMKDIAKMNNVSKSSVTESVDTLEKKGYVRRVRGDADRRDIYIEPTEKANAWVMQTESNVMAYMEESLSRLTPEEQTQFLGLFNKFVGNENTVPYDQLFERTLKRDFKERKKKV
jgi:DNA-binding MarR family transcriptional regulator